MSPLDGRRVEQSEFAPGYLLLTVSPPVALEEGSVLEHRGARVLVVQCAQTSLEYVDRPGPALRRSAVLVRQLADLAIS